MKLALGTVQFGLQYGVANKRGQVPLAEVGQIIALARSKGMDTLDTAIAYGDSEQRLGEVGMEAWRVVSKLPPLPEDCPDVRRWVIGSVEGSCQRLRQRSLHGLLLHQPSQLKQRHGDALYRALQDLKQAKIVEKIGISVYSPAELEVLESHPCDLVQVPFNAVDVRLVDSGWMRRLSHMGVELHVRSVFLQGLLLMSRESRPPVFGKWSALWQAWDAYLRETHQSPLQACLRHVLSFNEIGRVIVGVDSLTQLNEIINASQGAYQALPTALKVDDPDLLNPSRWPVVA